MKRVTSKTILKQEIGEENCKEYGCGNIECTFECLRPKKIFKTYQPVENMDKSIFWEDITYQIIAQSQPKLQGVPVISLGENWKYRGHITNLCQYTQKDIEKAIELSQRFNLVDGFSEPKYEKEEILEQINSISVIEVDEQFNVISYE